AITHIAAIDDHVDRPVLELKLTPLETLGQSLAHRLLNDARAREADEGARLSEIEIAEHGEACGHPARRRVRHDGNVRQMRLSEPRERRARLRHLLQREE